MSDTSKSLNDEAWGNLFLKYDILNRIDVDGQFVISATQIKEFREPRLMVKFDHTINLPKLFADNQLAILPITRGDYVIAHFEAYHEFEEDDSSIIRVSLPSHVQSLDSKNVSSEAIALNCAAASGIVEDFLKDEDLIATVSGRMGSGTFGFNINNSKFKGPSRVEVNNSQIEIDAGYEGVRGLSLFEAKRDLSDDFMVRQLYYPYRVWKNRIIKTVRTVFLVYSNGIYHLYEYKFQDPNNYSSLALVKQKKYTIEDTAISVPDIQKALNSTPLAKEPNIPFPQADNFERVINLCELLNGQELSRNDVTDRYAFDERQTNYYTDAARYLGLLEKRMESGVPMYSLSEEGKRILSLNFKQRQLAFCESILSHKTFADTLHEFFSSGVMPSKNKVIEIMKTANLYKVESESTFGRRSSTVKGWINWMLD